MKIHTLTTFTHNLEVSFNSYPLTVVKDNEQSVQNALDHSTIEAAPLKSTFLRCPTPRVAKDEASHH